MPQSVNNPRAAARIAPHHSAAWIVLAAIICVLPFAIMTWRAPDFAVSMAWKIGANLRRAIQMAPAGIISGLLALAVLRQRQTALLWAVATVVVATLGYAVAYSAGMVRV
jgi:hypothetical protein